MKLVATKRLSLPLLGSLAALSILCSFNVYSESEYPEFYPTYCPEDSGSWCRVILANEVDEVEKEEGDLKIAKRVERFRVIPIEEAKNWTELYVGSSWDDYKMFLKWAFPEDYLEAAGYRGDLQTAFADEHVDGQYEIEVAGKIRKFEGEEDLVTNGWTVVAIIMEERKIPYGFTAMGRAPKLRDNPEIISLEFRAKYEGEKAGECPLVLIDTDRNPKTNQRHPQQLGRSMVLLALNLPETALNRKIRLRYPGRRDPKTKRLIRVDLDERTFWRSKERRERERQEWEKQERERQELERQEWERQEKERQEREEERESEDEENTGSSGGTIEKRRRRVTKDLIFMDPVDCVLGVLFCGCKFTFYNEEVGKKEERCSNELKESFWQEKKLSLQKEE